MTILSPNMVQKLSRRKIVTPVKIRTGQKGERHSQHMGSSLDFSGYRLYTPGDDVRQIDWNSFARSQKHYIKQFYDERELRIHLFIDCSRSMGLTPEKWKRTLEIASSIVILGTSGHDSIYLIQVPKKDELVLKGRGAKSNQRLLQNIETLQVADENFTFSKELSQSLTEIATNHALNIVISDALEPVEQLYSSLAMLQKKGQRTLFIRVLDPTEKDPHFYGDRKLKDIESYTLEEKDISFSQGIIRQYKKSLEEHEKLFIQFCKKRGITFAEHVVDQPLGDLMFQQLAHLGWVKG